MGVYVSVTSLTVTPLTYGYKVRYELKANVVLKVFDLWISLKILRSKVTALFAQHSTLLMVSTASRYIRRNLNDY